MAGVADLHDDLMDLAQDLATRERGKPKQASLRRAVSSAYYALFHRLTFDAARFLVATSYKKPHRKELQVAVRRAFDHAQMKQVARSFGAGAPVRPWRALLPNGRVSPELQRVGQTFVSLQERRHSADYDAGASFARADTLALVARLRRAFADLDRVPDAERDVFLTALAFHGRARG